MALGYEVIERRKLPSTAWNDYVDAHPQAWFWHREEWLNYSLDYTKHSIDKSFAVLRDGAVVGICPAITCGIEIRMGDDACIGPLASSPEATCEVIDAIRSRLTNYIANWRWNRGRGEVITGPLLSLSTERWVYLSRWLTSVVPLNVGEKERWRGVRKSYRSLINQSKVRHQIVRKDMWDDYKTCHQQCATRPRSNNTYDHQHDWFRRKLAHVYCVYGEHDKSNPASVMVTSARGGSGSSDCSSQSLSTLSAAYVITYKNRAYYASGPSLVKNTQHRLQWEVMQDLSSLNVHDYELGWISDDGVGFFKSGWGHETEVIENASGQVN
jgi:hypothetical protein